MIVFLSITISLYVVQVLFVVSFLQYECDTFKSKRDVILWLIPFYWGYYGIKMFKDSIVKSWNRLV